MPDGFPIKATWRASIWKRDCGEWINANRTSH